MNLLLVSLRHLGILFGFAFFLPCKRVVMMLFFAVSRHRTLMNVFDKAPVVDKDAFVAPSASVIGDVQVGKGSSIWYGCVLRGKNFGTQ